MSESGQPTGRRWIALAGVAATLLFLGLALRGVNLREMAGTWRSVTPWPWLPLAIASYLAGHVVRGARCSLLFGPQAKLSVPTASNIVVIGYACNNILPLRLGELTRAGMLTERTGAPLVQSIAVIFVERLLDGIAILALLLGVSTSLPVDGAVRDLLWTGAAVFGVALVAVVATVTMPWLVVGVAARVGAVHPRVQVVAVRLATSTTSALRVLRDPVVLARAAGFSLVIWTLESGLFAFMLRAFALPLPARVGVLAMGVTNLGVMVPSTPGFIGPFHYFCQLALSSQGIGPTLGMSVAVAVHLAFYVSATLWGALALSWYGVELGAARALARRARESTQKIVVQGVPLYSLGAGYVASPGPRVQSDLVRSIVEAVVMKEGDAVTPVDAALLSGAADFVEQELRALPTLLATAVVVGLTGFRLIVAGTHLRPFCSLPIATRRRIIRAWAYGPIGLTRTFFRPIRSLACMGYYELLARKLQPVAPTVPAGPVQLKLVQERLRA